MREYLFTTKERKIIETYVESGTRLEGFNQLNHRMKAAWPKLLEDLTLAFKLGATEHPFVEEYVTQIQELREWLGKIY
jgi:hypothetical protein